MAPTFRNEAMMGGAPDWTAPASPDFAVIWKDPADAELRWERDEMHFPTALAPLAVDFVAVTNGQGLNIGYEYFDVPLRIRFSDQHGHAYFTPVWGVPEDDIPKLQRTMAERFRAFGGETTAYWTAALRELAEIHDRSAAVDVDGLLAEDLASAWQEAWNGLRTAWGIHFVIIRGAYRIAEDLANLYSRLIPEAPAGAGYRLIQGRVDILHEVDLGLERLVGLAAATPPVAAAVRRRPPPSLEDVAAIDGANAFVAEIRAFLGEHGHLGQKFSDLAEPSWAEDPSGLLLELATRLDHETEPVAKRRERLLTEADAMAGDVRQRIRDRPDDLAEFEELLALAREVGPLTETHNYWIDRMSQARLRRLATRIGERLVRDGSIDDPLDVLYLHRDEIGDLVVAPRRVSDVVAERRAEHARQRAIVPPRVIGRADPEPAPAARDGVNSTPSGKAPGPATPTELKGTGASAGVVRGRARVTLGPEGFARIGPGDIIVAPATNPSWVPIFTVAAGLVTNTGGVLAHAAVVAREFGLPAVVGLAGATVRIPDGQWLEIDGTTGLVRLLEAASSSARSAGSAPARGADACSAGPPRGRP